MSIIINIIIFVIITIIIPPVWSNHFNYNTWCCWPRLGEQQGRRYRDETGAASSTLLCQRGDDRQQRDCRPAGAGRNSPPFDNAGRHHTAVQAWSDDRWCRLHQLRRRSEQRFQSHLNSGESDVFLLFYRQQILWEEIMLWPSYLLMPIPFLFTII